MVLPGSGTLTPGQLTVGLLAPKAVIQLCSLDSVLASGPGFTGHPRPAVLSLASVTPN